MLNALQCHTGLGRGVGWQVGSGAYCSAGGPLQLHEAVRVQMVHVHVQLPVPLHVPLAQVTLQVGRSS